MKKNDIIELAIEDLSVDGAGIGKYAGTGVPEPGQYKEAAGERAMVFFVKDALIGDRIRAKVMKLKKNYGFARLLEVLEPSPDRVEPPCGLHRKCGGCQLQALSYEKQSRVFVYTPLVEEKEYIGQESHSFLERYYDGDITAMLSAYIEDDKLSESEIDTLRSLLAKGSKNRGN